MSGPETPTRALPWNVGSPATADALYLERPRPASPTRHLALLGPSRVGKTSYLLRLRDEAQRVGHRTALVDLRSLSNRSTPGSGLLRKLTNELDLEEPGEGSSTDASFSKRFVALLRAALEQQPVTLLLDECNVLTATGDLTGEAASRMRSFSGELCDGLAAVLDWTEQERRTIRLVFSGYFLPEHLVTSDGRPLLGASCETLWLPDFTTDELLEARSNIDLPARLPPERLRAWLDEIQRATGGHPMLCAGAVNALLVGQPLESLASEPLERAVERWLDNERDPDHVLSRVRTGLLAGLATMTGEGTLTPSHLLSHGFAIYLRLLRGLPWPRNPSPEEEQALRWLRLVGLVSFEPAAGSPQWGRCAVRSPLVKRWAGETWLRQVLALEGRPWLWHAIEFDATRDASVLPGNALSWLDSGLLKEAEGLWPAEEQLLRRLRVVASRRNQLRALGAMLSIMLLLTAVAVVVLRSRASEARRREAEASASSALGAARRASSEAEAARRRLEATLAELRTVSSGRQRFEAASPEVQELSFRLRAALREGSRVTQAQQIDLGRLAETITLLVQAGSESLQNLERAGIAARAREAELQAERERLTAQIASLQGGLGSTRTNLASLREDLRYVEDQLATRERELASVQSARRNTEGELARAREELASVQTQLRRTLGELATASANYVSATANLQRSSESLATATRSLNTCNVQLAACTSRPAPVCPTCPPPTTCPPPSACPPPRACPNPPTLPSAAPGDDGASAPSPPPSSTPTAAAEPSSKGL